MIASISPRVGLIRGVFLCIPTDYGNVAEMECVFLNGITILEVRPLTMHPSTAIRLCDEILDFCEGWCPQTHQEGPLTEGAPHDVSARVLALRERVLCSQQVNTRQAAVLEELTLWIRRCRSTSWTQLVAAGKP
jgi:hypothetical protein